MEDVLSSSSSRDNQADPVPSAWADCSADFDVCDDEYPQLGKSGSFDLRQRLSRTNIRAEGEENDHTAVSPSKKQRQGDRDLRHKLSRGGSGRHQSPNDRSDVRRPHGRGTPDRRRGSGEGKSRYTDRLGGLSPLRSPRSDRPHNILDLDNSRNYRFTKHKQGESPSSSKAFSYNNTRRGGGNRARHTNEDITVLSASDDDSCDEETRRRLQLPSENGGVQEDLGEERLPMIVEEDEVRLARREKDISYGKNTDAYKKYIQVVPKNLRSFNVKKHPKTPEKLRKCSRRSWDAQIKIWKRRIHSWANDYEGINSETDRSETEGESSESLKNNSRHTPTPSEYTDDEANQLPEDEDDPESFLASADIDFSGVAHQVQEQVKLEDE